MFHSRSPQGLSPSLALRSSTDRPSSKFCENGRTYVTDSSTGQPICLCQLENHPAHSLQGHPALRGMRPLPTSRPVFDDMHNYHGQLSSLTPGPDHTNGLLATHVAFHPYGPMYAGMDVNGGPIRKAATRETTGPLKIWLSEHKKNPYPTKAEKIMLAIITRMTLTQVSTWFANARRRLKKDNRLSPGGGEEDNVGMDSDRECDTDSLSVSVSVDVDRDVKTALRTDVLPLSSEGEGEPDSFSDITDDENEVFRPQSCNNSKMLTASRTPATTSSPNLNRSHASTPDKCEPSLKLQDNETTEMPKVKPKIWSISHILDS